MKKLKYSDEEIQSVLDRGAFNEATVKTNAVKTHNAKMNNIEKLTKKLKELIDKNTKAFGADDKNWSYNGDLGYVEDKLQEIVNFLNSK